MLADVAQYITDLTEHQAVSLLLYGITCPNEIFVSNLFCFMQILFLSCRINFVSLMEQLE